MSLSVNWLRIGQKVSKAIKKEFIIDMLFFEHNFFNKSCTIPESNWGPNDGNVGFYH